MDCIFCKISAGNVPSFTIYEDDDFKVILDRFPSSVGHTLIIPKSHVENIYELPDEISGKLFILATKVAKALKNRLNCDGLNVLQNNGIAAGQTVMHFHLHLIPRYKDDTVSIKWRAQDPALKDFEAIANLTLD